MDLFDFQETGRDFIAGNRFAFLADEPGLGKTCQTIRGLRVSLRQGPTKARKINIAILCPRSAIENWRRELKRWWTAPETNPRFFVCNYDKLVLPGFEQEFFNSIEWDYIVCDEAHRLKHSGAIRTKVVYHRIAALKKSGVQVKLLSGTPARNHAGEMWTHLAVLRPDIIRDRSGRAMTQEQFEDHFCDVYFDKGGHRRIRGSKNIGELRGLLDESGFLLRRRKSEVRKSLPPLVFDEYPLPHDGRLPPMGRVDHLEGLTIDEALTVLQEEQHHLMTERRLTGLLKVPPTVEFVQNELDAPGKIILFFWHTDVGRELYRLLAEFQPVLVDGKTSIPQDEVDTFQHDDGCRLFIGQIMACGEALNITAANQVAFVEAAWSPADNYQAACRAHRIGLEGGLLVRFLSLAHSTDELVQRVLTRKTSDLTELFD
jgi:SNF2 family DNA or RNA helicase